MPDDPGRVRICADHYLMTLAHYFSGSLVLPEALAAYRRHGCNSFSTLPVLGSWGALTPGDGQAITDRNFAVMLDHVHNRYETLASIFGRRRVRKFSRRVRCFLAAEAVRAAVARVIAWLRNPEPELLHGPPHRVRTTELSHND
jgi:hypothetical protein